MKPISAALPLLFSLSLTAWVPGEASAEGPLEHLPPQTAAVAKIRSIDALEGNFNDLLTAIGPVTAPAGPGLQTLLGEGIFNVGQNLDVLDRSASAYVAVFALPTPTEPFARFVKAPDETKLRRAVLRAGDDAALKSEKRDDGFEAVTAGSRTAYFSRRGDWIVYSDNEAVLPLLDFDAEADGTFASLVEPRAAELLAAGDGAVFVNVAQLTKQFADQIEQARQELLTGIEQLPDEALQAGGTNPATARKLYSDLANSAFDALFDVQWAASRVSFSARGAGAEAAVGVTEDSATDRVLTANAPSALELLEVLPAGVPFYFGMRFDTEYFMSWYQPFLAAFAAGDAEQAKALNTIAQQFQKAGLGQVVGGFALPSGADSGMRMSLLFEAANTALLRSAFQGYFAAVQKMESPVFTQTFTYQAEAESYKDRPVDLITQSMQFADEQNPQLALAQGMLDKFFGKGGLQTRLTALDNLLVEATGNDPKFLHTLIDGLETGEGVLGLGDAFAQTRDELGEQANVVLLLDAPNLIVSVFNMLRDVPPFDMVLQQVPFNFGAQPAASYAGVSLGTEPQGLRAHVFVPVEQPKGILQLFGQVQ